MQARLNQIDMILQRTALSLHCGVSEVPAHLRALAKDMEALIKERQQLLNQKFIGGPVLTVDTEPRPKLVGIA